MCKLIGSITPVEKPIQRVQPLFDVGISLIEVDRLIRSGKARSTFSVDGSGLAVAVLDTGINADHVDFSNRIPVQVNFTNDNGANDNDAKDGNGHGTNVSGIIAANGDHVGVAPSANIVPIKVLSNSGGGSFDDINKALKWVLDNHKTYNISVVCMSLGNSGNYDDDSYFNQLGDIKQVIQSLKQEKIAVVIAAGNDYYKYNGKEGMSYPAIIRECVSVGAVYDCAVGSFSYGSGAAAKTTKVDQITPFSQRLHDTTSNKCYTDIFAPGAPITSSGIDGPHGESTQHGTSQATPVVCGVILLIQQFYQKINGTLPTIDEVVDCLRLGGVSIFDGDDEDDNVIHTKKNYLRVDALGSLSAVKRQTEIALLRSEGLLMVPC